MSLYLGTQLLAGIATNTIYNAHTLLDFKWTDHLLNDQSWLRADTFSWQDGTVYSDAYNHLVDDYNGSYKTPSIPIVGGSFISDGTYFRDSTHDSDGKYAWNKTDSIIFTNSVTPSAGDNAYTNSTAPYKTDVISSYSSGGYTETVGSYTITYVLSSDGHKITTDETNVANIYNESGVAWYYILDTTNQRFKLPRENPAREELIQIIRAKGDGMTLGLTDGTTNVGLYQNASVGLNNAVSLYGENVGAAIGSATALTTGIGVGITTDPTKSGIISSMTDSTSVYKGKKYLYFYVGQFSQTATEQTAGLNVELFNGKLDLDAGNATQSTKETIVGWGIPDYDSAVSLSAPTTSYQDYTATKPCMIELLCFYMAGVLTYKINNHEYNIGGNTTSQQQVGCLMHIYLGTGDVLSYKTQYTNTGTNVVNRATMFPLKGA